MMDNLESIVDKLEGWNDLFFTQASDLLFYLNSYLFYFLAVILNKIFTQVLIFYCVCQNRRIGSNYGIYKITYFQMIYGMMKWCYKSAVGIVDQLSFGSNRKQKYEQIYLPVVN